MLEWWKRLRILKEMGEMRDDETTVTSAQDEKFKDIIDKAKKALNDKK